MEKKDIETLIDMYSPILLTSHEAAEFLGISYFTFNSGRKKGIYPEPVYITEHRPRWNVNDLVKWMENGGMRKRKVVKK